MSTNINITVGGEGLLDRAQQQQTANRQAQLSRENSARLEAEATAARTASLAAQGLDANGNPITGAPFTQPQIDRRPAANRSSPGFRIGHSWYFADVSSSRLDTGLTRFSPVTGDFFPAVANSEYSGPSQETFPITRPVYIGSGNGAQWVELTESISGGAPPHPADNTALLTTRPVLASETAYIFTRTWGSTISSADYRLLVLPAGGDNLIVVYRQQALWNQLLVDGLYFYILNNDTGERVNYDFPFPDASLDFMRAFVPLNDSYGIGDVYGFIDSNMLNGFTRQDRCFIVSNVGLREISTPQPVLNILEQALPTPVLKDVEYIVRRTSFGFTTVNRTHPTLATPLSVSTPGFASYGFDGRGSDAVTPEIYQLLNNSFSFTNPADIKPPPTSLKWALADGSKAGYKRFYDSETELTARLVDAYNEEQSFAYGQWVVPGEVPPSDVWEESYEGRKPVPVPRATLRMAQDRPARQGGDFEGDFVESRLHTVFDWNDPAYCRSMCTALGFTSADLTP